MAHFLILFKNCLFEVVKGDSASIHTDILNVYSHEKVVSGERVAQFAREAIVGYKKISEEDAAEYRLFWADLVTGCVAREQVLQGAIRVEQEIHGDQDP